MKNTMSQDDLDVDSFFVLRKIFHSAWDGWIGCWVYNKRSRYSLVRRQIEKNKGLKNMKNINVFQYTKYLKAKSTILNDKYTSFKVSAPALFAWYFENRIYFCFQIPFVHKCERSPDYLFWNAPLYSFGI